jgi:hypothetical protein
MMVVLVVVMVIQFSFMKLLAEQHKANCETSTK